MNSQVKQVPASRIQSIDWPQRLNDKDDSLSDLQVFYLKKVDSLIQAKALLFHEKINHLQTQIWTKFTDKQVDLDSISSLTTFNWFDEKISTLDVEQYTKRIGDINALLNKYYAKITDGNESAWIENYNGQLNQLQNIIQQYKEEFLDMEELNLLQGYNQQLKLLSQQSQGYFQQTQDFLNGDSDVKDPFMQYLETNIGHYPEFQELQNQTAELEKLKSLPSEYQNEYEQYQNKEYLRQKATEQAQKLVKQKFTQHQDKIEAAQKKLAAYKKKYSSVQSTKDMSTAVKRNSLEGRPISERLVLGGTFQINRDPTALDLSPLLGYRLNKKFTVGVGVTYRAILDFDEFDADEQVYGYRGYIQREAFKGFFVHGEYERMNTTVEVTNLTDDLTRKWVSGGLMGIGKEYGFLKGIKGQVMVLYNFLHEYEVSPYQKPWVLRFGFVL